MTRCTTALGLGYGVHDGARMTDGQRRWLAERLADRPVAVVGVTGAVGLETLALLAEAGVEAGRIRAFASERSAGRIILYGGGEIEVEHAEPERIADADAAILALDAELSRDLAPRLVESGAVVIDHSSAFRLDPSVPLVIPEINGGAIAGARLIASPNCTTTIAMIAADPIRRLFGIETLSVVSYQAASGAGTAAVRGLAAESRAALDGAEPAPDVFPVPAAFNVFPHESLVAPGAHVNNEELKIVRESRRIWDDEVMSIEATCLRVPVFRTHTVALRLALENPATVEGIEAALRDSDALEVCDESSPAPTSLDAAGRCMVLVGRVRPADPTAAIDREHRVFTVVAAGDQLLKGSAWNGLQIAARALDRAGVRAGRRRIGRV